jgi:glycine/D-amino acid oxidase-like deaminating enzyme/nitrite reductase/ring-hydroxylating ferredoxin subunit
MSQRESVWLADRSADRYPELSEAHHVDVVVVGGGITGLTTALLAQRKGAKVAVIERNRIGSGTTGHSTGKVTSQHGLVYHDLLKRHGPDVAGSYADANQWAVRKVSDLASELAPEAHFESAPAIVFATDPEATKPIEAEYAACLRLGLPASLSSDCELPFEVARCLQFEHQGMINPANYCHGLAREISEQGGLIFEETSATGLSEDSEHVVVTTPQAELSGTSAVIATLLPFVDRALFFAKTRPGRAYGVAALLRAAPPPGMYISSDSPTVSLRPWGERGLVIIGEGHPPGDPEATPGRWGELERWARDNFEVESFEFRWSSQDYRTFDGLPFIGPAPRMSRTYVATGFGKWGLTNGTVAAAILSDLVTGSRNSWEAAFDSTRLPGLTGAKNLTVFNATVGKDLIRGVVSRLRPSELEDLPRGDARLVEIDGKTVGAYRDAGGDVHAVSLTCTHLGCTVAWNDAERSWDCPCHGSRFSLEGKVLEGPATQDLEQVLIDGDQGLERP